ncbi:putative ABC-type sulfate transporter [Helianthus annuus]|nr:putative ABC-type sulfate transporter [Helianthus annuus]
MLFQILGLDICADTMFGDDMRRGISGGQKKRLTTGEMIVGPTKALYMDEISNGLDSSTTYQIITCLQQLAHITDASILISLLQPSPEAFDLFDDIMLMAEGMIVYHGPRSNVLEYFEGLGFKCPERKGVADFLQEVVSRKDQAAYWCRTEEAYNYVSVQTLSMRFKQSCSGKEIDDDISKPFTRLQNHEDAISFHVYSLSKWDLFKACMSRELLLMKRNSFVYIFKTVQLTIIAVITMTVFLRTRLKPDSTDANYYLGSLFYALIILIVDGFPEAAMTVSRLPNFYKQRDMYFYPAWAYAIPASILKIPLSLLEATIWTCLTYYVIGYSPEPGRFFRQLLLLFGAHFTSISLFRFLASVFQTVVSSTTAGGISILFLLTFGGFIIPHTSMPAWLKWGFWFCPLSYGEIGLAVNEFLSPRWNKMTSTNTTIGLQTLKSRGLDFEGYYYWICLGALYGFALLFNIGFILALSYFKGKMVLPFEPLTVTFQDLQYYVEPSPEMREHGFTGKRLQLLRDITGAFRPGVLTALMGVSGAGKTTLLDVLAGRKTSGIVEGEIRIGGYPKVQDTFARISGYCEQIDVHSPQITVEESVIFSAWLRLHPDIDSKTKYKFIEEIMETVELYAIKDSLVGIPGVSGLSTEQRKRLTIAVEVVANPSIIFMDEPTTGLDARSAAIVMRAVKNIVDTGRTIVCTIHQPSIDIFEAFDELILLKNGGRMIYCGPVGHNSCRVIEYFESISGVPKIRDNYNPATWMLEITSASVEAEVGVDFGQIYSTSTLYE